MYRETDLHGQLATRVAEQVPQARCICCHRPHSLMHAPQENARLFQRLAAVEDFDSSQAVQPTTSRATVLSK